MHPISQLIITTITVSFALQRQDDMHLLFAQTVMITIGGVSAIAGGAVQGGRPPGGLLGRGRGRAAGLAHTRRQALCRHCAHEQSLTYMKTLDSQLQLQYPLANQCLTVKTRPVT